MPVRKYAWATPNQEALEAIAAWGPIVEIGAGTGYWASLLAVMGVDVVAYDICPAPNEYCDDVLYFPVEVGTEVKASEHPDRTLMLCWPPYPDDMAVCALRHYAGNRLVYIGEGYKGCCASDAFFELVMAEWSEVRRVSIPRWPGCWDAAYFCERL